MRQLAFIFLAPEEPWHASIASRARRRADVGESEPVVATRLANRIIGRPVLVVPHLETPACLGHVGGGYQVLLREIGPDANFDIAHEVAHYLLKEEGYVGPDEERHANQIAAHLLAPTGLVRGIIRKHGKTLKAVRPLSKTALISKTAAHFRLGEVLGDGRVVMTAETDKILVRSTTAFDWSKLSPKDVYELAHGKRTHRKVSRLVLTGGIDEGRVALRSA